MSESMGVASCPAVKAMVPLAECRRCSSHVDGVGCPHIKAVRPREWCLTECPHNQAGVCAHPKENGKGRPPAEVWDSEAPMCALPRLIQVGTVRLGPVGREEV